MYNSKTHVGGMYHLPGQMGDKEKIKAEWDTILKMVTKVDPSEVRLYPCGFADPQMQAIDAQYGTVRKPKALHGDRDNLRSMFDTYKKAQDKNFRIIVEQEGRTGIYISANAGGLVVEKSRPRAGEVVYDLKTNGRKAPQGCTVYNIDINYNLWNALSAV
jgi:hypothetical protein